MERDSASTWELSFVVPSNHGMPMILQSSLSDLYFWSAQINKTQAISFHQQALKFRQLDKSSDAILLE